MFNLGEASLIGSNRVKSKLNRIELNRVELNRGKARQGRARQGEARQGEAGHNKYITMSKQRWRLPTLIHSAAPASRDIGFSHPVFCQCYLPSRRVKQREITLVHGGITLQINAGEIWSPANNAFVKADLPYGSAARLVLAHIQNHIIRHHDVKQAAHIDMGSSLRQFLNNYGLGMSGQQGRQIEQQVNNVAAMSLRIAGAVDVNGHEQYNIPIATKIEFWREKNTGQLTFWQPSLVVSDTLVTAIKASAIPLDMRAIIALYQSPKAIDLYMWLAYRLPRALDTGEFIPFLGQHGLAHLFGSAKGSNAQFKQRFAGLLDLVLSVYPAARVQLLDSGIKIFYSPPSVPTAGSADSRAHDDQTRELPPGAGDSDQ